MGVCFSTSEADDSVSNSNSAIVISSTGELRPYSTPVFVSDVLQTEGFFVCNSDNLCYDEHIIALKPKDELDAGQIYFVLPVSKLRHRLGASEMGALAVKASVALNSKNRNQKKKKNSNNRSKISPFVIVNVMEESDNIKVIVDEQQQQNNNNNNNNKKTSVGVSRSGSIRKMKMRSRLSFKLRLSTIYESDQSHSHRPRSFN